MNKFKPFFNGNKNDDAPNCYNRVRYIRDSCKVLVDIWKIDKDSFHKNIDSDISKVFKEFRSTDVARSYRSPDVQSGTLSILNSTIDDLIEIHEYIDGRRKIWLEQFKEISEQARDKQSYIRQTMAELRDHYERALRKFETADSNLKKYQTRSDRQIIPNYDERFNELDDNRRECDQNRIAARDAYETEVYRVSSEENSITRKFFLEYLLSEQLFYTEIQHYLSIRIPEIEQRLVEDKFAPSFHRDLSEHCSKRIPEPIAYPIEMCIHLLKESIHEEGIFRIAPSQVKQKKLAAELDLQLINKDAGLNALGYDAHVPANTLKQYLRELPDCLLTDKLLQQWNEVTLLSNDEDRVQRISQLINQLPKVNYYNLCYLMKFLYRVSECSSENKMTSNNIGICIGCSVLYPKDQSVQPITNSSTIVELMITHFKQLFQTNNQQDGQVLHRLTPDIIPIHFQSKNQYGSAENLIDYQPISTVSQPSPRMTKHRAPPPPPPPLSRQMSTPFEPLYTQRTQNGDSPTSDEISFEQKKVINSPSLNPNDKNLRHNNSHENILERQFVPPPAPPSYRPRPVTSIKHREVSSTKDNSVIPPPLPNDDFQNEKSNFETKTRTNNSSQINPNNRLVSLNNKEKNSSGEITQF